MRNNALGFSLIEVVIAMAITVFAIVSIMTLLGGALQSNRNSEQEIEAANLAATLLLQYRNALDGKRSGNLWPGNFPIKENDVDSDAAKTEYSTPIGVAQNGLVLGGVGEKDVKFGLSYKLWREDLGEKAPYYLVNLGLRLMWPPVAINGKNKAVEHYDTVSSILVPK